MQTQGWQCYISHNICLFFLFSNFYSLLYSCKNTFLVRAVSVCQLAVESVSHSPQGKPISSALGWESSFFSLAFFIDSLALCHKTFKDPSSHGLTCFRVTVRLDLGEAGKGVMRDFICMYEVLWKRKVPRTWKLLIYYIKEKYPVIPLWKGWHSVQMEVKSLKMSPVLLPGIF